MRSIHYSIRYAVVLIIISLFYLGVAFLFHETVQLPVILTLLITVFLAERMWILLDWIGPVVGTMGKKKQEQDQKQAIEYLLENSLRYGSPLAIAAICTKKRISVHVLAHHLRRSDVVLRSSAGYLLVLMPFTPLENVPVALTRLAAQQLPIKGVVMTDVPMLQALARAQGTQNNEEATDMAAHNLRRIGMQALDEKVAAIQASSAKVDTPLIYSLFGADTSESLFGQLNMLNSRLDALSASKDENVVIDSH